MVNLFILGCPGSGKSSMAELIRMCANDKEIDNEYYDDYTILYQKFKQEKEQNIPEDQRNFRAINQDSEAFDVVKFSVLDDALNEMKKQVVVEEQVNHYKYNEKINIFEFARDDYSHALYLFGTQFLQRSLVIYLDVDLDTCIERVHQRKQKFVSEDIMRNYYCRDDWEKLQVELECETTIKVKVIKNVGSLEELQNEAEQIVDNLYTAVANSREKEAVPA